MNPDEIAAASRAFGVQCQDCLGEPGLVPIPGGGQLLMFRHDPTCPFKEIS